MVIPIILVPFLIVAAVILKIFEVRSRAKEKQRLEERNADLESKTTEEW